MNQEKFLQTLKTLKFPDVEKYSTADFDDYFADPELLPFLEYFSSLDEKNVLTPEELKEYNSIPPDELANLENLLMNEEKNIDEEDENEKNDEEEYLKDHLAFIEKRCKTLQDQKEKLIEQQSFLSEEKAKCQAANLKIRRLFDDCSMNKLPQIQTEFSSTIKSISELLSKLKLIVEASDTANDVLPGLNMKDVEEYFEVERKIVNQAHSYLSNNFEFLDESMSALRVPGLSSEDILNEISYLKKALLDSKMSEYQTICELKEKEIASKYVESPGNFSYVSEISSSQLSLKLEEERKNSEKLEKKEAMLFSQLSAATKDRIDAQCREILIARSNETFVHYKQNLEKISFPLQQLMNQKARLELFKLYLNVFQKYLLDIKTSIDQVSSFLESEEKSFEKRKLNYEKFFNATKEDKKYVPSDSVFFSAYKILNGVQQQEASNVMMSDIIQDIEKLVKDKELMLSQKEEIKDTIENMEEKYSEIEKIIVHGSEFRKLMKSEKEFSDTINQLEVSLTEIHKNLVGSEKIWSSNNKLLETNQNLKLGRSLFLYALLEREKFEEIIEKIETDVEYVLQL